MSKLYTEEQVTNLTEAAFMAGQNHNPFIFQIELNKLTPIELPTDEEIEEVAEKTLSVNFLSFIEGTKWMRDKIKGGGDE
jgi:hypothetical protein